MNYADRPGKSRGRALHAILFPQRKDGRRPDRPVPRAARRAIRARRASVSRFRRSAAGRSGSTASSSIAAGSAIPSDDFFAEDPVRLLEMFALAAREQLEIHPTAMRAATRDAVLIDRRRPRRIPRANALFLEVLTTLARSRAGAALDERGRRVRPLRPRFRPRRRADAVRHVPPLYRRRAFHPRDRPARRDRARRAEARTIRSRPRSSGRSCRAECSMSRCCSTTSPRGAAATIASSAPRSR